MDFLKQVLGLGDNIKSFLSGAVQNVEKGFNQTVQNVEHVAAPVLKNAQNFVTSIPQDFSPPKLQSFFNNTANSVAKITSPFTVSAGNFVHNALQTPIINNPVPGQPLPFKSPTLDDVRKFLVPMLQAIPRSGFEGAQTLAGDRSVYASPNKFIFGNDPLRNFNDPNRPAGQFLTSINAPEPIKQLGTPFLALAGAIASDIPFIGGAEEAGARGVIALAGKAKTVEQFAKSIDAASPEIKMFVSSVFKDAKSPINTIPELFSQIKAAAPKVAADLTAHLPQGITTQTIGQDIEVFKDGKFIAKYIHGGTDKLTKAPIGEFRFEDPNGAMRNIIVGKNELQKNLGEVLQKYGLIDNAKPAVEAAAPVVPAVATDVTKAIEPSVVQFISPTGEKTFKTITQGELEQFKALVDNSGGTVVKDAAGNTVHLSAKTPAEMEAMGFKNAGVANINDIPKPVPAEVARATVVPQETISAAKNLENMGYSTDQVTKILAKPGEYERIVKENIAPFEHSTFPINNQTRARMIAREGQQAGTPAIDTTSAAADSAKLKETLPPAPEGSPLSSIDKAAQKAAEKANTKIETLSNILDKPGTNVKNKVGLLDYLRTPDRVLNKIGLGEQAKLLRQKYSDYIIQLPKEIAKVTAWSKEVPKGENQNLFRFLDGQKLDVAGNPIKLSPEAQKVAGEIKSYLGNWADQLGLPKDKRITNYITHIFDKDFIQKEFDPEIAKMIQDRVAGSVYDPFVMQRLGKLGFKEDTWAALDAYVKRATRKVNMDVALEQVSKVADNLEQSQFNYVKQYIDRVNMRPTQLDNLLDNTIKQIVGYKFGQRPTTYLSSQIRKAIYRGTLGLNVGSALKNLTQGVNTYAKLGERYTLTGYFDLVKSIAAKSTELVDNGVLNQNLIEDRTLSATKQVTQKAENILFSLFQAAETINRGSAYFGAKAKALAEGKTLEEAVTYAKQIVRDTQFTFGSIDTPPVLQSDIGKMLLQFQSFNLKQGEFLGELAKNKDWKGLARYIGGSLLVYGTLGQAIGMKPQDMIPSIKVGSSPFFTLAGDVAGAVTNAKDKYGQQPTLMDRAKTIGGDIVPFIPGGVQAKKTIQSLIDTSRGYSETSGGNVKFPITPSVGNTTRALLFGENNLPEAKAFFDNGSNSLSAKQSAVFRGLAPEQRAAYIQNIGDQRLQGQIDAIRAKIGDGSLSLDEGINQITKLQNTAQPATTTPAAGGTNPITDFFRKIGGYDQQTQVKGAETQLSGVAGDYAKAYGFEKYIQPNNETGINKYKFNDEQAKIATDIYNGTGAYKSIPDNAKNDIYAAMGFKPEDVQYTALAGETVKVKSQFVLDALGQAKDHNEVIQTLYKGRKQGLTGDMLVTDTMVTDAQDAGFINAAEAKALKAVKLDTSGNEIKKAGSGTGVITKSQTTQLLNLIKSSQASLAKGIMNPPKLVAAKATAKSTSKPVAIPKFRANTSSVKVPDFGTLIANSKAVAATPQVRISGKVIAAPRQGSISSGLKISRATFRPRVLRSSR